MKKRYRRLEVLIARAVPVQQKIQFFPPISRMMFHFHWDDAAEEQTSFFVDVLLDESSAMIRDARIFHEYMLEHGVSDGDVAHAEGKLVEARLRLRDIQEIRLIRSWRMLESLHYYYAILNAYEQAERMCAAVLDWVNDCEEVLPH